MLMRFISVWLVLFSTHSMAATLSNAEYWFDDASGTGTSIPLASSNLANISEQILSSELSLEIGNHQLYLRIQDSDNEWSDVIVIPFYVEVGSPMAASYSSTVNSTQHLVDFVENTSIQSIKTTYDLTSSSAGNLPIELKMTDQYGRESAVLSARFNHLVANSVDVKFDLDLNEANKINQTIFDTTNFASLNHNIDLATVIAGRVAVNAEVVDKYSGEMTRLNSVFMHKPLDQENALLSYHYAFASDDAISTDLDTSSSIHSFGAEILEPKSGENALSMAVLDAYGESSELLISHMSFKDTDGDYIEDSVDTDIDGDGCLNEDDEFPLDGSICSTPTATPTVTATSTVTPSITTTPTVTSTPTATITVTQVVTATMTVTPTVTSTVTPTVIPTITPTATTTPVIYYELQTGFDESDAPVISGIHNRHLAETGETTYVVYSSEIQANDTNDGMIEVFNDADNSKRIAAEYLATGRNIITWQATDSHGNRTFVDQQINIYPKVEFAEINSLVVEGRTAKIAVKLSGDAPEYPVTVHVNVIGGTATLDDHTAVSESIELSSKEGFYNFIATPDEVMIDEDDMTVELELAAEQFDDVFYALGNNIQHTVTITDDNQAPEIGFSLYQNAIEVTEIDLANGMVTIIVKTYDANYQDTLTVLMTANGTELSAATSDSFWFDASSGFVSGDQVSFELTVTDNGDPQLFTEKQTSVNIVDSRDLVTPTVLPSTEPTALPSETVTTTIPAAETDTDTSSGSLSTVLLLLLLTIGLRRKVMSK